MARLPRPPLNHLPALWRRSPAALLSYPALLASVVCASALVAFAATSGPLVSAASESSALKDKLASLTPFATGLEVTETIAEPARGAAEREDARDAAVERLVHSLSLVGTPIRTTFGPARTVLNGDAQGALSGEVVPMVRTGALQHVRRLRGGGPGVWIADNVAEVAGLAPGDILRLGGPGAPRGGFRLHVAGVYRALAAAGLPDYWINFVHLIRTTNPDLPRPPTFMFADRATVERLAGGLGAYSATDVWELPIDPHAITLAGGRRLERHFAATQRDLTDPRTPVARSLGCRFSSGRSSCEATSALSSALLLARESSDAVSSTTGLLAGIGLAIALGVAGALGIFLARRRDGEVRMLFARGEPAYLFSARVAVEVCLPALAGAAAGAALAVGLVGRLSPHGTLDRSDVRAALEHAALAVPAAVVLLAAAAALAYPRRRRRASWLRILRVVPWELGALAAAGAMLAAVLDGQGLVKGAGGIAHPRLIVFAIPLLATAGVAGLLVRAGRRVLPRPAGGRFAVYVALRRLAAARGLLTLLFVGAAVSLSALFYAESLDESLQRSAAEKAYLGTGSDVSGVIDPGARVPASFPYPATRVQLAYQGGSLGGADGPAVDILAVDPRTLGRTMRWRSSWGRDPRPLLARLDDSAGPLPVIVTGKLPRATSLWDQGTRVPIHVVAAVPAFPGMTTDRPLVVVSATRLAAASARLHLLDPLGVASASIWVRGPTAPVERALRAAAFAPDYLVSVADILASPDVRGATRTYGFLRAIGASAGLLALVALVLYLQVRRRSQVVASALGRRMGVAPIDEVAALALEIGTVLLLAGLTGAAVAVATAGPIVRRVDPLQQLAPSPSLVVPWGVFLAVFCALAAASAAIAALAGLAARRGDIGEALRVV